MLIILSALCVIGFALAGVSLYALSQVYSFIIKLRNQIVEREILVLSDSTFSHGMVRHEELSYIRSLIRSGR